MGATADEFAKHIALKLWKLGYSSPRLSVVLAMVERAYFASLRTEEGRFVQGSLTFADPSNPELDPPLLRRADYPAFHRFGRAIDLNVDSTVKLFQAVDKWSASVAVYGGAQSDLVAWGIVDQLVGSNISLHNEGYEFSKPGILTIMVDGVASISAYHEQLFIGRLKQNQLVKREFDAIRSAAVGARVYPTLAKPAKCIASAIGRRDEWRSVQAELFEDWASTLSRVCIALRRLGTGGSLLIATAPVDGSLDVVRPIRYDRLGDSLILSVLDRRYLGVVEEEIDRSSEQIGLSTFNDYIWAQGDLEDRTDETSGAVKVVASLAAADGAILFDPSLRVVGFGV